MKQKLKKLNSLLLFGIVFILYSCEKDLIDKDIPINHKISLKEKKIDEMMKDEKFVKSIKSLKNKNVNMNSRTIMEDFYGFTIDSTANVKEIVSDGNITYTIKVVKDTLQINTLNNLIVKVDTLNNTKACIVTYNLLENAVPSTHESFNINYSSVEIKGINYNYNSSNTTGKLSADCIEVAVLMCNNNGSGGIGASHAAGTVCCSQGTHLYTSFISSCTGGGGTELTSSPTDTPHGGGGGSEQDSFPDTPCGKLQKGTSSVSYMNKFNALNTQQSFNLPYETGFVEKKVSGVTQYVSQAASGADKLTFPSNAISYTHVHNNQPITDSEGQSYDGGVKMLSPVDLLQLITKCSTAATAAGLTPLDVQGVMISDEGIFALTIIDSNISIAEINTGWKEFVSEYNRKSGDIINDLSLSSSDRSEKLQEMMLNQLEILGLKDKVALFQGEVEMDPQTGKKINWTRKTLNVNKRLEENPC